MFRFAQHLERLARGADFLKIKLPFTPKEFQEFAEELVVKNNLADAVLRVTVTRGSGERGYVITGKGKATVAMTLHSLPPNLEVEWNLITSSFRVSAADPISSFKTTSRILNVMARAEAQEKGADEALFINTNGEVAETASGNLFWIYDEKVCTVPTGRGILPGVTRAVVLEICQSLGLQTNKRVIKLEALQNSQGLFVTQSVFGIMPVKSFDGRLVTPSPLVDQIAQAYSELLAKE
jgi:branched-subunit amino acid aminotransferase/4-amino-4-deoxychorismate lyase